MNNYVYYLIGLQGTLVKNLRKRRNLRRIDYINNIIQKYDDHKNEWRSFRTSTILATDYYDQFNYNLHEITEEEVFEILL